MRTETRAAKCRSKRRYPTTTAATRGMHRTARETGSSVDGLRVYECGHCDHYHFGHTGKPRGKRTRRG